jgi:hypothetical protein
MSVDYLEDLTVTRFESGRRAYLFSELRRLVGDLSASAVVCELWINGSFLTEKEEPDDIDLSFCSWVEHLETLDTALQDALIDNLNGGKLYSPALDTYYCPRFRREDPRYPADTTQYWGEKWSKGWDDRLKGYAVLTLGETDVGLRLCA